jgi:UDP-glucuronate decarboxylase
MRVLIAGGAGFLGKALTRSLLLQGHSVVCLDNFQTSSEEGIQEFLLFDWCYSYCRHDVTEPLPLEILDDRFDRIYNLACAASPPLYQLDPVHTMLTSVIGTNYLLDLSLKHRARFLLASTSEAYGDPEVSPQPETYRGNVNTTGPRSCYDEGKRAAETLTADYGKSRGADVRIARIFNTYGPGMSPDDGRVVSNFIVQAIQGKPITVYGDGSQTRSFCFVTDTVYGLMALMESDYDSGPVNIGNPVEMNLMELLSYVMQHFPDAVHYFLPLPVDDPKIRCPDISLARSALGWHPTVTLRDGLAETINYFKAVT